MPTPELERLVGAELDEVVLGQTWRGRHFPTGVTFIEEIGADGTLAYMSDAGLRTGRASISDGQLCVLFEGSLMPCQRGDTKNKDTLCL